MSRVSMRFGKTETRKRRPSQTSMQAADRVDGLFPRQTGRESRVARMDPAAVDVPSCRATMQIMDPRPGKYGCAGLKGLRGIV